MKQNASKVEVLEDFAQVVRASERAKKQQQLTERLFQAVKLGNSGDGKQCRLEILGLVAMRADLELRGEGGQGSAYGGMCPIHVAALLGVEKAVSAIAEARGDLDVSDDQGMTALHVAVQLGGGLTMLHRLVQHGASLEAYDLHD